MKDEYNFSQAIRNPYSKNLKAKKALVRISEEGRTLTLLNNPWNSFFLNNELTLSDDFMQEREVFTLNEKVFRSDDA